MKKYLSVVIFLCLTFTVCAQIQIERSTEKVIISGQKYYMHTVKTGQTLYSISRAYNVRVSDIKAANPEINETLKPESVIKIPIFNEYDSGSEHIIYVVRPGDTLYSLCRKYGITLDDFYVINDDLKKNTPLKAGQKIKLPSAIVENQITDDCIDTTKYICHLVIKGETLYSLAKKYSVTNEEIFDANPSLDGNKLKVGMVLQIPKITSHTPSYHELFIDSLSKVNSKDIASLEDEYIDFDDEIAELKNYCDSALWYKNKKDFKVAILLPFDTEENMKDLYIQDKNNKKQTIGRLSKNMLSFYNGCLLALDNFSDPEIDLNINVYDIGRGNTILGNLITEGKLSECDIIIGPAFKSQVEFINDRLNDGEITFLLPFVSEDDILKKYSNNIMFTPNNITVKEEIANYISTLINPNIIIIQGTGGESIKAAVEYQKILKQYFTDENTVKIIKYDGKELSSLNSIVDKNLENIFISTIFDEASTTQILTNLFPLKDYDITFFGNENMLNYETIDPLYYSKVKFTYHSHSNINYKSSVTENFILIFRDNFLHEPDNYAFCGYDLMNEFIDLLLRHGKGFIDCLNKNFEYEGLSGKFNFVRNPAYGGHSYANKTIYLYSLQPDYSFKLIYPLND
ncbi:MAG: LysM peptidoglycan-binding domain-containing protein [Bacteroidales bacterium]|jgi:LysM repeat protein|nr:LysM peptidoglycan-binding domain-containing protein [Bacteroidales bacterium]